MMARRGVDQNIDMTVGCNKKEKERNNKCQGDDITVE